MDGSPRNAQPVDHHDRRGEVRSGQTAHLTIDREHLWARFALLVESGIQDDGQSGSAPGWDRDDVPRDESLQ